MSVGRHSESGTPVLDFLNERPVHHTARTKPPKKRNSKRLNLNQHSSYIPQSRSLAIGRSRGGRQDRRDVRALPALRVHIVHRLPVTESDWLTLRRRHCRVPHLLPRWPQARLRTAREGRPHRCATSTAQRAWEARSWNRSGRHTANARRTGPVGADPESMSRARAPSESDLMQRHRQP